MGKINNPNFKGVEFDPLLSESGKGNGFPKIITGVRRCGKSYLLKEIFKKHLLGEGLSEDNI